MQFKRHINFIVMAGLFYSQMALAFEELPKLDDRQRIENSPRAQDDRQRVENSPKAQDDIQKAKNDQQLKDNLQHDKTRYDTKQDIQHDKDRYEAKQDVKKVENNPKTQAEANKFEANKENKTNQTNVNYNSQKTYNTSYQAPSYSAGWGGGTGFWAGVATVTGVALVSSWISSMFRPQPAVVATSPTYVTNNYPPQSSTQATQAQPQVVNNYYGSSNPSSNNQGNSSSANTNANQQTAASAPNSTPSTQANTPIATDANQSMPPQQPQDDGQSDFMKIVGYLAGLTIWLILLSGLFLLVRKIRNKNN